MLRLYVLPRSRRSTLKIFNFVTLPENVQELIIIDADDP
jgi:hypothetical protein